MSPKPAPQESFVQLWAGESPALHEALLDELELSAIPYWDKPIGEDEVAPTADPLPIDWKPRFGFEVSVPSSSLPAAKEILEKLLDEGQLADVELPDEEEAPAGQAAQNVATEEPATVEVWAGSDPRTIEFLIAAMQENEIPIRVENDADQAVIYVAPSSAARAREIVREVTEGEPPE
jgi:hypothetical protein